MLGRRGNAIISIPSWTLGSLGGIEDGDEDGMLMDSVGGMEKLKLAVGDRRPGEITLGDKGEWGEARVRVEILEVSILNVRLIRQDGAKV